jgi:hypothetical protein
MDKYFCAGCLRAWHVGHIMDTCKGCRAHLSMGWTCPDLVRVYGATIRTYGKAYFPALCRECPPPVKYSHTRMDMTSARTYLDHAPLLDGFRAQQHELLDTFEKCPTRSCWRYLDPDVQRHLTPLDLRYT